MFILSIYGWFMLLPTAIFTFLAVTNKKDYSPTWKLYILIASFFLSVGIELILLGNGYIKSIPNNIAFGFLIFEVIVFIAIGYYVYNIIKFDPNQGKESYEYYNPLQQSLSECKKEIRKKYKKVNFYSDEDTGENFRKVSFIYWE